MSFDKHYPKRKDRRKPYYRSGKSCRACRPGGSCGWCRSNRLHKHKRREPVKEKAKCQEEFQRRVFDLLDADPGPQRGPASSARIHAQTKAVMRELDTIADHWHAKQEQALQREQENKRLGIDGLSEDLVNRFHRSAADNIDNKAE